MSTLEIDIEQSIDWFNNNHMIANQGKFEDIVCSTSDDSVLQKLVNIETTKSLKLHGTEIDHQLRFKQYISTLKCQAAKQWNALGGLQRFVGKPEKPQK